MKYLILILLVFVLYKESSYILQFRSEAASISKEARLRSGTDSRIQSLRTLKTQSAAELARIDEAAISKSELAHVVSFIENTGKEAGLAVSIASINTDTKSSPSTPIVKMLINTTGGWSENITFIHLLENMPYKLSVDQTNLSLTDKGWQNAIAISLTTLP